MGGPGFRRLRGAPRRLGFRGMRHLPAGLAHVSVNGVLPHLSTTLGHRATTHKFQRTLLRRLPALEKHQKAKVVNSCQRTASFTRWRDVWALFPWSRLF